MQNYDPDVVKRNPAEFSGCSFNFDQPQTSVSILFSSAPQAFFFFLVANISVLSYFYIGFTLK